MDDCLFCKIISKEIPADGIYEDDEVFAFLDIRPVSKGHALVISKKHTPNVLQTDDETLKAMLSRIKRIAQAIIETTQAAGFNLTTNTGLAAGQSVFHTHFHIIPRADKDGLVMWKHHDVPPKTRAELAEVIKNKLKV